MKVLVDMNLSPAWAPFLATHGVEARHWSTVGDPAAADTDLLRWCHEQGHVLFTHDLDFGQLLARAGPRAPSVIQLRTRDVLPDAIGALVVDVLARHADALAAGALVTIDVVGARVRILPLRGALPE